MSKQSLLYIRRENKLLGQVQIDGTKIQDEVYPSIAQAKRRSRILQAANGGIGCGAVKVEHVPGRVAMPFLGRRKPPIKAMRKSPPLTSMRERALAAEPAWTPALEAEMRASILANTARLQREKEGRK